MRELDFSSLFPIEAVLFFRQKLQPLFLVSGKRFSLPRKGEGGQNTKYPPPPNGRRDIKSSFFAPNRREGEWEIRTRGETNSSLLAVIRKKEEHEKLSRCSNKRKERQRSRPSKTAPNIPRRARKEVGITSSLVAVIRKKGAKHPSPNEKGAAKNPPLENNKKQLLRAAARRRDLFAKFSCDRGGPFRHFSA